MKESQLDNKTAIATNDYVRMVDENGNSVKIKKDSFMAAIRDALPSIISDGETGGGSVLSIINGALKTRTDANLASVLGVFKNVTVEPNANTITKSGYYICLGNSSNTPSQFGMLIHYDWGATFKTQQFVSTNTIIWQRCFASGAWGAWKKFSTA